MPIMPILEAKSTYLATQKAGFWKRGKSRRLMEAYRKAQPKEQKKGAHPKDALPRKMIKKNDDYSANGSKVPSAPVVPSFQPMVCANPLASSVAFLGKPSR